MQKPIVRQQPRPWLVGEAEDGEQIKKLPGDWVVWWYEKLKGNKSAETNPIVEVVFRRLNEHGIPSAYTSAQIGLASLSRFRIGTIWRDGECIADTDFGDEVELAVKFEKLHSADYTSFMNPPGKTGLLPISNQDYAFRYDRTGAKMLNFSLPNEKNLLIPCIEFYVRCYGSKTSIPAIIATHPWVDVEAKLFASEERDAQRWSVPLKKNMSDGDGLFLASILYDRHAMQAARRIRSQFDLDLHNRQEWTHLEVEPWFHGLAKVCCRGYWVNGGNTFLCLEVTGMSQPHKNQYEIIRDKFDTLDPIDGDQLLLPTISSKIPPEDDPFRITDQTEPGAGVPTQQLRDPGFAIIGEPCPHKKTYRSRAYSSVTFVPVEPQSKENYALGSGSNGPASTGRVEFNAERFVGDGGVVSAMWAEMRRLNALDSSMSLAWYRTTTGYTLDADFKLQPLQALRLGEDASDQARRWLSYPTNSTKTRGILISRLNLMGRTFHLFEVQRKKIIKKGLPEEEKTSGLLLETGTKDARLTIDFILQKLRYNQGKFKSLESDLDTSVTFKHYRDRKGNFLPTTTLRSAFNQLGIRLEL